MPQSLLLIENNPTESQICFSSLLRYSQSLSLSTTSCFRLISRQPHNHHFYPRFHDSLAGSNTELSSWSSLDQIANHEYGGWAIPVHKKKTGLCVFDSLPSLTFRYQEEVALERYNK